MFSSLRFRLPVLFLAGIVVAGLVASAIAVGLFQDLERQRSLNELRREAKGIAPLYEEELIQSAERERPLRLSVKELEEATGDHLFSVGGSPLGRSEVRRLPDDVVDWQAARIQTFEFELPGEQTKYLAVAHQVRIENKVFGALVVAKPESALRERWIPLMSQLALAFIPGVLIAALFASWLSRRFVRPLATLSQATDELARGRYDVDVPRMRGRDEIAHLSGRFADMAARLKEASELERNFLMTVSHELRTPLTAIRGHVAALREGVADDPELRADSLAAIAAETGRLERLVGDILDLAKLESRRFTVRHEEVDMKRVVERAYSGFDQEARRRRIEYGRRIAESPTIVSDGDRVLQIITNLLSNAFRWTPDGGRIDLELASENGTISVAVADNGPGVSEEERDRIFRPFWSRDGRGTGLGLTIANELANALGGKIELDSEPGRGSRFELVLPQRTA